MTAGYGSFSYSIVFSGNFAYTTTCLKLYNFIVMNFYSILFKKQKKTCFHQKIVFHKITKTADKTCLLEII